tara:strand:- start:407 stop:2377 length:1971 start_codon:yes stop_codon:yes gene_type:complete
LPTKKIKHEVRVGFHFRDRNHKIILRDQKDADDPPIISIVRESFEYGEKFKINDLILSVNGKKIKTIKEWFRIKEKLKWNQKIKFVLLRDKTKIVSTIQPKSFDEFKQKTIMIGVDVVKYLKNFVKVSNIDLFSSERPSIESEILIEKNDIILSINNNKISSIEDFDRETFKLKHGDNIIYKLKRKNKIITTKKIKIINFNDFLKLNEDHCRKYMNKIQADTMLREYEEGDYMGISDERRAEIMKLGEPEYEEEDQQKLFLSTKVMKKKLNGKDIFLVKFVTIPDEDKFSIKFDEGKKIYLKIYVYDVTDLSSDKYYELEDYGEDTENYFNNNCHVIKTEDFSWSEGNNILVQSKELKSAYDFPSELAFPFSVLQLPKYGKRKLEFRSFVCTEDQKFNEEDGRFLFYKNSCFRPEECYLATDEYAFDDYGDYTDIYAYSSSLIFVEYKQPGYLETNKERYDDLKIALSFALKQHSGDNLEDSLEKVKEKIRYGDYTAEGNIKKILSLKKNYQEAKNSKIKLDDILKDLKKNSFVHERYQIIDFLLNLATDDETFTNSENSFIDKVSEQLELNKEKYQEIKKQKTASVKLVDFGERAGESVFGITKDMDKQQKLKLLRKEYSRWNALTNNTDKTIRERARQMRDLAANLRSEYNRNN